MPEHDNTTNRVGSSAPVADMPVPVRVAPIVTMAVQERGGCGQPLDVFHVCIADREHDGEHTPCHVDDVDTWGQGTIETLRTALRSARDFIVGHPAVSGEWPLLVRHIDHALAYREEPPR